MREPPVWNLRSPEVDEETQREHVREIEALLEARYGDQLESVEVDFVIRRVYDDMLPWDWEVGVYAGEYALKGTARRSRSSSIAPIRWRSWRRTSSDEPMGLRPLSHQNSTTGFYRLR